MKKALPKSKAKTRKKTTQKVAVFEPTKVSLMVACVAASSLILLAIVAISTLR